MQMKTFTGFASTPDLGGAFNQGASIAQRRREAEMQDARQQAELQQRGSLQMAELNQKNAQAQAELELQMQRLDSQQKQQMMSFALEGQKMEQELLVDRQRLAVDTAYKDAQINLEKQKVKSFYDKLQLETKKASQTFNAQRGFQQDLERFSEQEGSMEKGFMKAALKWGPQMDLPGAAYGDILSGQAGIPNGVGAASDVEGLDPTMYKKFQEGPKSFRLVQLPRGMEEGAPEGYTNFGGRALPERESSEAKYLRQERNRLVKLQDADIPGKLASMKQRENPDAELTKVSKIALEDYKERAAQIKMIDEKLSGKQSEATAPSAPDAAKPMFKEGDIIRSKKDRKKLYRIENGVPVPYNNEEK